MIEEKRIAVELAVDFFGSTARRFANPTDVLQTTHPHEVVEVLRRADEAVRDGNFVAGYLTYEAGASLVGVPLVDAPADRPLLALGVYDAPGVPEETAAATRATTTEPLGPLVCSISQERYARDLARIARALYAGDVCQVNYTVPFEFTFEGDARALFDALRSIARVPYASYVRHGMRAFASLAPELFIEIDDATIRTKPMKGTGSDDRALASEKNRAEHTMIVDLLRNDLHRICTAVEVESLFDVVRFPTFSTMTSTVRGTLAREPRLADIFGAMFPCGSITGAPKRAAMSCIAACEAAPRGIAMGTIGYVEPTRRGYWSVAIRTLDLDRETGLGTVRIGGGIVADSTESGEWAEVLVKRRVFERVARPVSLLETMRVSVDGGIVRLASHLDRLERSAFALGIPFNIGSVARAIDEAAVRPRIADEILRLELSIERVTVVARPLDATATSLEIGLAPTRLRECDPLLRHKTSHRAAYDDALAYARARGWFDCVMLNEAGDVADGSRTTVFVTSPTGTMLTPRLADGAVAGVLRGDLLRSGRAFEARVTTADLETYEIYVGNSVRDLTRATYVRTAADHPR